MGSEGETRLGFARDGKDDRQRPLRQSRAMGGLGTGHREQGDTQGLRISKALVGQQNTGLGVSMREPCQSLAT